MQRLITTNFFVYKASERTFTGFSRATRIKGSIIKEILLKSKTTGKILLFERVTESSPRGEKDYLYENKDRNLFILIKKFD